MENLQERINKKIAQIEKLERLYAKYATDAEEKSIMDRFLETGDRTEYRNYLKANGRSWGGDAWSKANDLYDARQTLAKYQKQLTVETDRMNTLNEIPEALIEFKNNLIERWDRYDEWRRNSIREDMHKENEMDYKEYKAMMWDKWGRNYMDLAFRKPEDEHKSNVKDAETLILNLINRVTEKVGQITDAQYLRLDRDNDGFSIINGRIIGTKGECRVESIGAGGYNIQRYHIRVLVH